MAITIEKKDDVRFVDRGKCTYIRLWGEDRENIRKIAAWSGRSTQDVGEDLMRQAMAEVISKTPLANDVPTIKRRRKY